MSTVEIAGAPVSELRPRMEPERLVALYRQRVDARGELLSRARKVRDTINNDIVIPLPEISSEEKASVANLAKQGMDQMARRVASVEPTVYFPSLNPGRSGPDDDAGDRTRVMNGWHNRNKMKRRLGRRARHILAYATSPVVIKPDLNFEHARWHVRNPLNAFPGEDVFDDHTPPDCIFSSTHTFEGLVTQYGFDVVNRVSKPADWDHDDPGCQSNLQTQFELLEYMDDYEHMLVLMGKERDSPDTMTFLAGGTYRANHVVLSYARNYTGIPLVVSPGTITLDKQLGHFDGMIGMYQSQAALMALTLIGQRRTVWPREWVVDNPNEQAEIVTVPDPANGEPGHIRGASIETQSLDPSFSTLETMDRLEASQRMTAALPAEFGGFSQSENVRTGRRGQQVMGAAIDYTLAEIQDMFAESLVAEDERAIAVDRTYFNRSKTFHIPSRGFDGSITYTPRNLWKSDAHIVDYPIAGSDVQNLPIEGGQRIEMGAMSRRKFMEIDPLIKDADMEQKRIQNEALEQAILQSIQAQAADPQSPFQPEHIFRLYQYTFEESTFFEAFMRLQREVQEEQATPTDNPAEQQPGVGTPGMGVEQPPMEGGGPGGVGGLQEFSSMLGQLGSVGQAQHFRQGNQIG